MPTLRPIWMLVPLAAATLPASAQGLDADDRFTPIEEGFEDVSPQAESRWLQPFDGRIPLDFERVYEIAGAPGLLARRSGAVTAVFPLSFYNPDASAPIPPGTVFYVGELPVDLESPGVFAAGDAGAAQTASAPRPGAVPSLRAAPLGVGLRLDLRVPSAARAPAAFEESAVTAQTIWTSENYRRQRVGEILRGAVQQSREAEPVAATDATAAPRESRDAAGDPDPSEAGGEAAPPDPERGGRDGE